MSEKVPTGVTSLLTQALIQREQAAAPDKADANVVTLMTPAREVVQASPPASQQGGRDWMSAVELVEEAREAIRIAEEQNDALEAQLNRVLNEAADAIGTLQLQQKATAAEMAVLRERASAAEARAEGAEKRAAEAEEWLCRLHDSVVNSLGRTVARRKAAPILEAPRSAITSG